MSDLKSKLRGELALLMALEEEEEEQERRPKGPVGPHPLRNRPMPFGAQSLLSDRDRRNENEEFRPAHPLAGWDPCLTMNKANVQMLHLFFPHIKY